MIFKFISYFFIISVSAHGKEVNEKFAVSTQSFNLPDIPISYKFTNVHNYKQESNLERKHNHRQLESALKKYPVIQYAPLNYDTKPDRLEHQNEIKLHNSKSEPAVVKTGRYVHTGQEKTKHDHLEPKPLKEDDNVSQENYRSFISGHNVEAYLPTTGHYLKQGVDPFITDQDYYQKEKVNAPNFVYYQKTKDDAAVTIPKPRNIIEEPPAFKFIEFLPATFNSPARKQHKKPLPYAYSLHNQLSQEKQQQTYAHPRIHLNIARIYNIANQLQEAHLSPLPKALTLNNIKLHPQNTIMLPVSKIN